MKTIILLAVVALFVALAVAHSDTEQNDLLVRDARDASPRRKMKKGFKTKKGSKRRNKKGSRRRNRKNSRKAGTRGNKGMMSSRAVDAKCTAQLTLAMRRWKDQATNYKRQSARITDNKKKGGNKAEKKGNFAPIADKLVIVGGGNKDALMCGGQATGSGADKITKLVKDLFDCEMNIDASCNPENFPKPNDTMIAECDPLVEKFEKEAEECMQKSKEEDTAAEGCACWESDTMVKNTEDVDKCKVTDDMKKIKAQLKNCTRAFGACKRLEDEAVDVMRLCVSGNTTCTESAGPDFKVKVTNGINQTMSGTIELDSTKCNDPKSKPWSAEYQKTDNVSFGIQPADCVVSTVSATNEDGSIRCFTRFPAKEYLVILGDNGTSCEIAAPTYQEELSEENCCPSDYYCTYENGTRTDCDGTKCPSNSTCQIPESRCCPDGEVCMDGNDELLCTLDNKCPAPGTCKKSSVKTVNLDALENGTATEDTPYENFSAISFQYIALYTLCTTSRYQAVAVRNALQRYDRRSHWFVYVGKTAFFGSFRRDQVKAFAAANVCGFNMLVYRIFKPQLPIPCPRLAAQSLINQAVSNTAGKGLRFTARYIYANEFLFGIQHVAIALWDGNTYQWASYLVQSCAAYNTRAMYYLNKRRPKYQETFSADDLVTDGDGEENIGRRKKRGERLRQ